MTKKEYDEIVDMMNRLCFMCYKAKVPIITVIEYKDSNDNNAYHYLTDKDIDKKGLLTAESRHISPAMVNYPDDNSKIYDIMNILNGNFKTVPDIDPEEQNMDYIFEEDDG